MNLIVTFLLTVSLLPGTSSADLESNIMNTLADHLNLETCDLYLLRLTSNQLSELSHSNLSRPFYDIGNEETVSPLKSPSGSACFALVYNVKPAVRRKEFGNAFRRHYVINDLQLVDDLKNRFLGFDAPILIFTPGAYGPTVDVNIFCPHAIKPKRSNVWTPGKGYAIYPLSSYQHSCPNILQNQLVEVSGSGIPPYFLMSRDNKITGTDVTVLDIIAKKMGFRYRITFGGTWGNRVNETAWTGVMGKVLSGAAKIGIGQMAMNDDRKRSLDFTTPLYNSNLYLITTKPRAKSPYLNIAHPFALYTWLALLGSLAAFTFTVLCFTGIRLSDSLHAWQNSTACLGVLLQQSGAKLYSNKLLPLIAFGFWCVLAFFINAFYHCNFRSYLMQVDYEKSVNTPEEMVSRGHHIYLAPGSIYQNLLSQSPNAALRDLFKSYVEGNLTYTYVNGFIPKYKMDEIIKTEGSFMIGKFNGVAYLEVFDKMYGYVPMRIGNNVIFQFYSGFVMEKRSPWLEEMDMIVLRLIQGGIITRSEEFFLKARYLREEEPDTAPVAFRLAHVFGALFLMLIGLVLSCISFLIELYVGIGSDLTPLVAVQLQEIR